MSMKVTLILGVYQRIENGSCFCNENYIGVADMDYNISQHYLKFPFKEFSNRTLVTALSSVPDVNGDCANNRWSDRQRRKTIAIKSVMKFILHRMT